MKIEIYRQNSFWMAEINTGQEKVVMETSHREQMSSLFVYNRMKILNPKVMIVVRPDIVNF